MSQHHQTKNYSPLSSRCSVGNSKRIPTMRKWTSRKPQTNSKDSTCFSIKIRYSTELYKSSLFIAHSIPFQIDSADVQSRQEYLRAQRDKILKIKKMARARQLNESVRKNGRPSSALAAQSILNGGSGQAALLASENAEPLEASMQLRKTLARRLRNEVVDDTAKQQ